MKQLKFLLIAILFAAFASEGFGQGDFLKNYTTPSITSPNSSDFSAAGVIRITATNYEGYVTVSRKTTNIILTKTDLFGNLLWTKSISASSYPNISFDSDDFTGEIYLSFNKNSKLVIVKLDVNGNVLHSSQFGESIPFKTKVISFNNQTYISTISIGLNEEDVYVTLLSDKNLRLDF